MVIENMELMCKHCPQHSQHYHIGTANETRQKNITNIDEKSEYEKNI